MPPAAPAPPSRISRLLAATSRTFALTIPLLPPPLEAQVGVAYLLYRLADTLEDAEQWDRAERTAALASFARWVASPGAAEGRAWREAARRAPPTSHAGYMDLIADADAVLAHVEAFPAEAAAAIRDGVVATTERMRGFVERQGPRGELTLGTPEELRAYCYAVAGIVGEVLTRLFVLACPPLAAVRARLDARARAFGEGLQLVNILKDAPRDAREGRVYVPRGMSREAAFALAARDLDEADAYVGALAEGGAPGGVVAFCALPVALARATLGALARGEAKLARDEAAAIVARITTTYR